MTSQTRVSIILLTLSLLLGFLVFNLMVTALETNQVHINLKGLNHERLQGRL